MVKRTPGRRTIVATTNGTSSSRANVAGKGVVGAGWPKNVTLTPVKSRKSARSTIAPPVLAWRVRARAEERSFGNSPPL